MTRRARDLDLRDARAGVFYIRNLLRVDPWLLLLTILLAIAGFVVLYSASSSLPEGKTPYYIRQMGYFAFGLAIAAVLICIDYRVLLSLGPVLYIAAAASLAATIYFGHEAKGAGRWIGTESFRFQPSEPSKVALLLALAWFLSTFQKYVKRLPFFLVTFALSGVLCVLILKQPSLSTAITLLPLTAAMLFVAGCRWWHLVALALIGVAAVSFIYPHLEDYQKLRVEVFLHPEMADPNSEAWKPTQGKTRTSAEEEKLVAAAWQPIQSKITVGSGGMKGKGFMKGTQTHLKFLPEHHTDFIFSLLAEEWGFVGGVSVIGLYVLFLLRGIGLARDCPDPAGTLIIAGATALFAFHTFVNIAITIGLMPVTGMPLPFLSYGGSFYITTMVCIGLILSVHARRGRIG